MSESHVFVCDHCGANGPATIDIIGGKMPHGWVRVWVSMPRGPLLTIGSKRPKSDLPEGGDYCSGACAANAPVIVAGRVA